MHTTNNMSVFKIRIYIGTAFILELPSKFKTNQSIITHLRQALIVHI